MCEMQSLLEENELTCAVAVILIPGSPTYHRINESQDKWMKLLFKKIFFNFW